MWGLSMSPLTETFASFGYMDFCLRILFVSLKPNGKETFILTYLQKMIIATEYRDNNSGCSSALTAVLEASNIGKDVNVLVD